MARLEFDIDSDVPAERVLAALTDFTENRPNLWPGLKPELYRVHATGPTWADVDEGSGGPVWAREHYDWSTPGTVSWTIQASGFASTGGFVAAAVTPGQGGGSRIHVTWERHGRTLFGRFLVAMIFLLRGRPVRQSIEAGLRKIGAEPSSIARTSSRT
jgi:hypothetical protein